MGKGAIVAAVITVVLVVVGLVVYFKWVAPKISAYDSTEI